MAGKPRVAPRTATEYAAWIGSEITKRWSSADFDEAAFADIACDLLLKRSPQREVDPDDVVRWVMTAPSLPAQPGIGSQFGQPPITLFAGERFYVDLYYWLDGTTSVHQHGF